MMFAIKDTGDGMYVNAGGTWSHELSGNTVFDGAGILLAMLARTREYKDESVTWHTDGYGGQLVVVAVRVEQVEVRYVEMP